MKGVVCIMKKILSLVLAMVMVLSLAVLAFAEDKTLPDAEGYTTGQSQILTSETTSRCRRSG